MPPAASIKESLLLLLACCCLGVCIAVDTITITRPIQDPETIVSSGQTFRLGFFSPENTSNRYVGILFNVPETTIIWVANRDRPLQDSRGVLSISKDGNLVILNGQKEIVWSSNVSNSVANSTAQILDTGNLVLTDNSNGRVIWESFQIPTDSLVPKMKLSAGTEAKIQLTSWRSPSDPSVGSFSAGLNLFQIPQFFVWENDKPRWRSGPWNGNTFIGIPGMGSAYQNRLDLVEDNSGSTYFIFNSVNNPALFYYKLNSSGALQTKVSSNGNWNVTWSSLKSQCDVYGKCGHFGSCNPKNSPICTCLPGFVPKDDEEWKRGNWTGGCIRKELLQCERNQSASPEAKQDGYLKLSNMKVPDFAHPMAVPEEGCADSCLKNCSCTAYAYYTGIGCMHWSGGLIDVQQFSYDGTDLHIRLAYSELGNRGKKRDMKAVIAITVTAASLLIFFSAYLCWKWLAVRKVGKEKGGKLLLAEAGQKGGSIFSNSVEGTKFEELPLYTYEALSNATNNFSSYNELGMRGFCRVYKGKLFDGLEVAVKRLSKYSGQCIDEFMNVISKLQHRNLVRLLGCCVERDEKMLVYEYMPNKSLDAYLFDERWKREDKKMNLGCGQTAKNNLAAPSSSASWKSGDAVSDQFPAGLRVLVVGDDPTCLRILEKMLINCLYEVTKCNRAEIALKKLRDNRNGYDIVISDVHMPDMDGFKLLERVGLEMDLPVIMMSADDSQHAVMKGVTHGACDYLIKPVRIEALKNIWQHVVRKRKHEWKDKDFEQSGSVEEGERQAKPAEDVDYSSSANEGNWKTSKKRKDEEDESEDKDDTSSLKKPRVVWSVELHQQFVAAVIQLGIDKAVPRKILELMNVPGLTRENVAIHLQKYRLYLRRLSGVSPHPNGHSFMGPPEGTFGTMPSLSGLDLQTFAATGQIPAQSLASLQALGRPTAKAHISMPVADQRNLSSFETPKLRFGDGQQQLNSNSKQINLLHGIPTNMEPKQLASLSQSAQSFGGISMQVNPQVSQSSSLLVQMPHTMPRAHMLNENKVNHVPKPQSSMGQPILANGMSRGVLPRKHIVDNVRGAVYSPVSQSSSLVDFSVNRNTEMPGNSFTHASNSGISSLTTKGIFQEEVNTEAKGSRGYLHGYNIFSELQQHKAQEWGLQNVGQTFDASQHPALQGSMDVSPSSLVQQGFSSSQKNRNAPVGDAIFSAGGAQCNTPNFSQQFNSFLPDNSVRVKAECLPDPSCHDNLFQQQFTQDDIMSALLKQQERYWIGGK